MARPIVELDVDISDVSELIEFLRARMTDQQFSFAMYGAFRDTSRHVKAILKQDIPKHYYTKAADIAAMVKPPVMTLTNTTAGCTIPLSGKRRSVGGYYSATGSARGWESRRKKYRVTARVVKGAQSKLPANMPEGGMPPFRNIPSKLGNATFQRVGKNRFPIKSVVNIALPQMPMTRSRDDVERDIVEYLGNRLTHRIEAMLKNWA